MDIVVDELIIEEDRPEHIAKHGVTVDEVLEVVFGDYVAVEGKFGRTLLIGQTSNQRLITIVVGIRKGINRYGLVTARVTKKREKLSYQENFEKESKK